MEVFTADFSRDEYFARIANAVGDDKLIALVRRYAASAYVSYDGPCSYSEHGPGTWEAMRDRFDELDPTSPSMDWDCLGIGWRVDANDYCRRVNPHAVAPFLGSAPDAHKD